MTIAWREALNTGDPTIDGDHKQLVGMVNRFEAAAGSGGKVDHKSIARILVELIQYAKEHFDREEQIQRDIQYTYYESHRRSHRDVIQKLGKVVQEYAAEKDASKRDLAIRHLSEFLREWLVNHIIEADLRMKPFIAEYQARKKRQQRSVAVSQ